MILVAQLVLLATALAHFLLEHHYRDRRTTTYRRIRWLLFFFILGSGAAGIVTSLRDRRDDEELRRNVEQTRSGVVAINRRLELVGLSEADIESLVGIDKHDKERLREANRLAALGHPTDAVKALGELKEKYVGLAGVYLVEGIVFSRLGDWTKASDSFETARRLNPRDESAWANEGGALLALGDFPAAMAHFDSALALNPGSVPAMVGRANVRLLQGDLEGAYRWASSSVKADSGEAAGWFTLARVAEQRGESVEERRCYRRALALDPSLAMAWYNLGANFANGDSAEQALTCFESALALSPGDPDALVARGRCLDELGEPARAEASFRYALAVSDGRHAGALMQLGTLLGQAAHHDSALVYFERLVVRTPRDPEAWFNRAMALKKLGRPREARESFARALAVAPEGWRDRRLAEAKRDSLSAEMQ